MQNKISQLKGFQQDFLEEIINNFINNNKVDVLQILAKHNYCKHCGSKKLTKNGYCGDIPRYKCNDCGKTQSLTSHTLLHGIRHVEKWVDFVYQMLSNKKVVSCVEMAETLDLNPKTIHSWRHKFLAALNDVNPIEIVDDVELDEVYIPFCVKGRLGKEKFITYNHKLQKAKLNPPTPLREKEMKMVKNNKFKELVGKGKKHSSIFLCMHNRNGDFDFIPLRIQQKGAVNSKVLEEALAKNNIDLSGKNSHYRCRKPMQRLMKNHPEINHISFRSSDVKKGDMFDKKAHNNNINNVMAQLKNW